MSDNDAAMTLCFDSPFFLCALEHDKLATNPCHAINADPFLVGPREYEEQGRHFLCSHLLAPGERHQIRFQPGVGTRGNLRPLT